MPNAPAILATLAVALPGLATAQTTAPTTTPARDVATTSPEQQQRDFAERLAERERIREAARDAAQADAKRRAATRPALPAAEAAPGETSNVTTATLDASLAQLDDRDPEVRQSARETLMMLTRDDLPTLRDAVAGSQPKTAIRAALRDVVLHVYLTGKHRFRGATGPYLGIIAVPAFGEPPTILARTIGYDGYRALRNGDVITALRVPPRRGDGDGAFVEIQSFATLRELLSNATVGQWIGVRLLRDGSPTPIETRLRISPLLPALVDTKGVNPFLDEAMGYWTKEFAPALAAPPTTRPAGG